MWEVSQAQDEPGSHLWIFHQGMRDLYENAAKHNIYRLQLAMLVAYGSSEEAGINELTDCRR